MIKEAIIKLSKKEDLSYEMAQAVMDEDYGNMIAMINGKTKRVPLGEVAGRLKTVDPDCQMIKEAKRIGISFGD